MTDKPVAVITGANQGIGLQVAKELVAKGFIGLVGSRDLARGEIAATQIGPDAVALQLDVTDQASIAAAAARIRSEFGRLDVLVNNAGISHTSRRPGETLEEFNKTNLASNVSLDELRAVFETNVFGVVAVFQAMLPLLLEAPAARVVNVSSGAGSLTMQFEPRFSPPCRLPPDVSRVQDGSERHDCRYGDRTGIDRNQSQCRLPGTHQDLPQQLRRSRDRRARSARNSAPRPDRAGWANRYVLPCRSGYDPLVEIWQARNPWSTLIALRKTTSPPVKVPIIIVPREIRISS
ncbi:NAD(P)-dependent dehydrogenase (short-subunit alcohol dehydrogenase family) [Glaciihabitans sp. UYNi722]